MIFIILLMNLWCWLLLASWTVLGALISIPLLPLFKLCLGWQFVRVMHLFVWLYGRVCMLIISPFVRFQIRGMSKASMPSPGIIIMNHYSFLDTFLLCFMPVFDVYICLRSWPFKMVWYSFFMKLAQYLDLESLPWEEILAKVTKIKDNGKYIMIFPEGHRSRTGEICRYYSGAFRLAVELDIPIVPICLSGTYQLLPYHRWWLKPATVKMTMIDPVYPDKYSGETAHLDMKKDVLKLMKDCVKEMESN